MNKNKNKKFSLVITVSGQINSGKDSLYEIVKESFPDIEVNRYAFGDALKVEAAKAMSQYANMPVKDIIAEMHDRNKKTRWRLLLQWWGTELRRFQEDNYWVRQVSEKIYEKLYNRSSINIITDARFSNELSITKNFNSILSGIVSSSIYIKRPETDVDLDTAHASESSVKPEDCDIIIENNGTYEEYREKVIKTMNGLLEKVGYEK